MTDVRPDATPDWDPAALEMVARDIRTMRIRGAGRIARAAAGALSDLARDWPGDGLEGLLDALRSGARTLMMTRPTAVSLRNAIFLTLAGAECSADLASLRTGVMERAAGFISSSLSAVEGISLLGMGLLKEGSLVMTHCNSDAALSVIEAAHRTGRVRGVIATESRPWRQGHLTVKRLASGGVPVAMIVDSASNLMMREVDAVVVGADTITTDGSVVNKVGTSLLALAAHNAGVPFYVCAETYKFSRWAERGSDVEIEQRGADEVADPLRPSDLPGVSFRNPVFDVTPPEHVTAIITENAVITPDMAVEVVREMASRTSGEGHDRWMDYVDGPKRGAV